MLSCESDDAAVGVVVGARVNGALAHAREVRTIGCWRRGRVDEGLSGLQE